MTSRSCCGQIGMSLGRRFLDMVFGYAATDRDSFQEMISLRLKSGDLKKITIIGLYCERWLELAYLLSLKPAVNVQPQWSKPCRTTSLAEMS